MSTTSRTCPTLIRSLPLCFLAVWSLAGGPEAEKGKSGFWLDIRSMGETLDLAFPLSMAHDDDHHLIYDVKSYSVYEFDGAGKLVREFGRRGQGPGEFGGPAHVSLNGGFIFVYDVFQRRLNRFDRQGNYIDSKRAPANVENIKFWKGREYTIFTSSAEKSLSIADENGLEIKSLTLRNKTPYTFTTATTVDDQGNIYCGMFDKYMIEVYDKEGVFVREITRPYEEIGPFLHKRLRKDVMLPVITGLQVTKKHILVLVGGMQLTYEAFTGKKLDDPNYLNHIDIYDRSGRFLASVWHDELPRKSSIFGLPLFSVEGDNVIWVAPLVGDLFRCELKPL